MILAVTLTRAPLLVPLTAMQGNLIAHFVDQRTERLRALVAPAAVVAGLGAGGRGGRRDVRTVAAAGGVRRGVPRRRRVAGLADGGGHRDRAADVDGAATVAAALHRAYSAGWVSATVASMLLLLLPLGLETRTVIALLCGPLVGIAVHLGALARGRRHVDRVFWSASTCVTRMFGSSSPPLTRRALSATSSPTFAPFSTTSSAWTTAARTTPATSRCGRGLTWCSIR